MKGSYHKCPKNLTEENNEMKILHLTLKKAPFEVMVTGEKDFEIREKGKWIETRLFNQDGSEKQYDVVRFTNGYGNDKPYFIAKYLGYGPGICTGKHFSNGFFLEPKNDIWIIWLGEIVERGNLNETKRDNTDRGTGSNGVG